MLLIHPPVTRPCEPPAGIARLKAALAMRGIRATVLDANLEGLLYMLQAPARSDDTWTRRAGGAVDRHLADMRSGRAHRNHSTYSRVVGDLNRLLEVFSAPLETKVSFGDYSAHDLEPVRSADLIRSAEHPEKNPFFGYYCARLPQLLAEQSPAWIGISVNYLSQALCAFALIGYLKQLAPGLRIVLGGGLISSWLRRPGVRLSFEGLVDVLVEGPGEEELCRLAGAGHVPRIAELMPEYESADLDRYLAPGRIIPYSASQGCYWQQCAFCPERAEGNPYRPLPAATAAQHLQQLSLKYSPALLHLLDNAISPALLAQLVRTPPGAPWYGFVRVSRELQDPDFCRALRASGCVMLQLGLESGSDRVLEHMGKGITVQESARVLRCLHEAGIATYVYLLFGTPWETEREAQMTLDFTASHANTIDFLNVAIFNMPAAPEQNAAHALRSFSDADLSLYIDFVHPEGWDRKSVRRFLDQRFKRTGAIASIIRSKPPLFGSNHAPFLAGKMKADMV
ncbi:MAG: radical SAM protein [Deltaproteobacteria bacterium]|nr:radical SAM protein [Deltaproteobacteria bacterium]